jgi:hypothetical protein
VNEGYFIDEEGNRVEKPDDPESPFPILCGPWPNSNREAIRALCLACGDDVGISQKGLSYHLENPQLRPTLCRTCMMMFAVVLHTMVADD